MICPRTPVTVMESMGVEGQDNRMQPAHSQLYEQPVKKLRLVPKRDGEPMESKKNVLSLAAKTDPAKTLSVGD